MLCKHAKCLGELSLHLISWYFVHNIHLISTPCCVYTWQKTCILLEGQHALMLHLFTMHAICYDALVQFQSKLSLLLPALRSLNIPWSLRTLIISCQSFSFVPRCLEVCHLKLAVQERHLKSALTHRFCWHHMWIDFMSCNACKNRCKKVEMPYLFRQFHGEITYMAVKSWRMFTAAHFQLLVRPFTLWLQ